MLHRAVVTPLKGRKGVTGHVCGSCCLGVDAAALTSLKSGFQV